MFEEATTTLAKQEFCHILQKCFAVYRSDYNLHFGRRYRENTKIALNRLCTSACVLVLAKLSLYFSIFGGSNLVIVGSRAAFFFSVFVLYVVWWLMIKSFDSLHTLLFEMAHSVVCHTQPTVKSTLEEESRVWLTATSCEHVAAERLFVSEWMIDIYPPDKTSFKKLIYMALLWSALMR